MTPILRRTFAGLILALAAARAGAQDEVVQMNAYQVTTDLGRYAEDTSSTATKVPTQLTNIPGSLQILNANAISDRKAQSLDDLFPYVIGMTRETSSSPNGFTIRGFDSSGGVQYWNVQTDGLAGTTSIKSSVSTADVERLEIIKGPNSVMYGQVAPGGLVNIVTKSPQPTQSETLYGSVSTYAGDVSQFGDRVSFESYLDLTGPIDAGKHLLYRLVGDVKDNQSFRDGVFNRDFYLYPSFTYVWSPETSLTVKAEIVQEKLAADDGLLAPFNTVSLVAPYDVHYQEPGDRDWSRGEAISLYFHSQLSDRWTLRASGRSTWSDNGRRAFQNTSVKSVLPVANSTVARSFFDNDAGHRYNFFDANIYGDIGPATFRHTLLFGISGGVEYFDAIRFASGPAAAPINIYDPITGVIAYPADGKNQQEPKEWFDTFDEYVSDQVAIGQRFHLLLGERHDQWNAHTYDPFFPGQRYYARNNSTFVGQAGLVYSITEPLSAYVSLSQSFSPNGLNLVDRNDVAGFPPQTGKQVEGGLKLQTDDKKWYATLALYDIHKSNVLVNTGLLLPDGRAINEVDGQQTSEGIEVETAWLPVPYWQVQGGVALMKAFVSQSIQNPQTVGTDLANAPRASGNLWTRYNIPGGPLKGLGLGLGIIYTGKRWGGSPSTTSYYAIPGFTRVDMAVYYRIARCDLALNVQNILDRQYIANANTAVNIYPGDPRKLTLSATIHF
jgi:iron complex outermembrane receptor protein